MENIKYKDSGVDWIGEIPAHWEVKKLEALVDILDNQRKPVSAGDRTSGEYPYWGAGKIMDYVDDYIFDGEYILLGEDGAPFFDKTRPVAHAVDGKFWANNHIHVLKAKNIVDRKFIVACLNSVNYKDFIKGAIIPKLNQATMRQLLIPVPPLSEQEAIAAKLDAVITEVDSVVANSEKMVAELKAYKSAVITEFITGQKLAPGFDNAGRERVNSNIPWIGMIPSDWKVVKADNMFNRSKERGNNKNLVMLTVSKNYGVIAQDEFNGAMKNKEGTDLSNLRTIHAGDHIISLMSFEGGIETSDIEGVCSPAYIVFRDSKKFSLDNHYFKWMFKSSGFVKALSSLAQGIRNGKTIKYDSFKEMSLMIPPLKEQQAISNFLDSETSKIDTQIKYYESLVAELKSFKQAIISEAVTGKINK